eukprot:m.141577 g.141577  ORF g.141577 m.141577 type:complete len:76 (+) comp16698_c1_seq3:167-394(+)
MKTVSAGSMRGVMRKRKSQLRLSKHVEMLVYLQCVVFLKTLAREANFEAHSRKAKTLQPAHISAVLPTVLKQLKG